jgi:predicted nucleic acid-binding protein
MADRLFIDTNILLYANNPQSLFHEAATAGLYRYLGSGFEPWISRQVLREFLSTKSRAMKISNTYDANTLLKDVSVFSEIFNIADETSATTRELIRLIATYNVGGKQIHDCNIVATMKANAIHHLLTHNVADFSRYAPELITVLPIVV